MDSLKSKIIHIRNLKKSFKNQTVLEGINIDISPGEVIGLLGPSGSGKTTLIRLMLGALSCDTGSVDILGASMPNREVSRRIGYMPQTDALYSEISGKDNLLFFGGLMGLKGQGLEQAVDRMLDLVNLRQEERKPVMHYSGGMKKRLSLAIALLHNPDILMLDEPTVGIDPILRQTVWKKFNQLSVEGKTLIITTHVMDEAEKCKRVILLHRGGVIADGSVESLKSQTPDGRLESIFLMTKGGEQDDKLNL